MSHVLEAFLAGDLVGPALDGWALDLDRTSAAATDQVMVVARTALAVEHFAVVVAQGVDLFGVGQRLQAAVDRRQADRRAAVGEDVVDLLRTGESVEIAQNGDDCASLAGVAAQTVGHAGSLLS